MREILTMMFKNINDGKITLKAHNFIMDIIDNKIALLEAKQKGAMKIENEMIIEKIIELQKIKDIYMDTITVKRVKWND